MSLFAFYFLVGPFLLLAVIIAARGLAGLPLATSGSEVAMTLAGIDVALAIGMRDKVVTLGSITVEAGAAATVVLLATFLAILVGLWAEKRADMFNASQTAVARGWCEPDVAVARSPFWPIVISWLLLALLPIPGNVGIVIGVFG